VKAPVVVKVGGAALADAGWLEAFAAAAARSAEPLLIVHGGGPEITAVSERLGVSVEWHEGRRVTTPAVLDAAVMVLAGLVNKRIVAALQAAGVDAVGLSGVDGALVRAEVAAGGAIGRVGQVASVRAELLHRFRSSGVSVVISPVSLGPDGALLNVNADEVAAAVAAAVHAPELLFLTDVPGVRGVLGPLAALSANDAQELVASGVASGGMAVKLKAALSAVQAGVSSARIGNLETLVSASAGTVLRGSLEAVA
jgi:acetylglutamate kinase